jgi:tRNA(fMet)-specific endonuclease VapC
METRKVIDTNLLIEGMTGLTTVLNVIEYPKALEENNELIWPVRDDYELAIEIMLGLLKSGKPVPAVDVLIAAICINRSLTLVTKDRHFEYIKDIREELSLEIDRLTKRKLS